MHSAGQEQAGNRLSAPDEAGGVLGIQNPELSATQAGETLDDCPGLWKSGFLLYVNERWGEPLDWPCRMQMSVEKSIF